jgi:acetolactate synthase regulatory subunit
MLYSGQHGKTLVSDEFNRMCVDCRVEATIQAYPNPGNVERAMRVVTFRNFNVGTVKVIQSNREQIIPGKGTLQLMLTPDEPLPKLERIEE